MLEYNQRIEIIVIIKVTKISEKIINNFFWLFCKNNFNKAIKKVFEEIKIDLESQNQMIRLLQGDVGSGKTVVALIAMLKTVESGYMTKDLAILISKNSKFLTTNQFLEKLDQNLKKTLN